MRRQGKRDCRWHVRRCFLSPSDFGKTRLELPLGYFSCVSGKFCNHIAAPLVTVVFFFLLLYIYILFLTIDYQEKRKIFSLCSGTESFFSDLFCPNIYISISLLVGVWNPWNLIFSLKIKWGFQGLCGERTAISLLFARRLIRLYIFWCSDQHKGSFRTHAILD